MTEQTFDPTTDVRDYFADSITFSLPKRDLFFIGQTLSTKYVNSDVAPFINNINRSCVDASDLDIDVVFTMSIHQLFNIIDKLGREPEFFYADFNKSIKAELMSAINQMEDEDLQAFIISQLTQRAASIENYKNALVSQYIQIQGL